MARLYSVSEWGLPRKKGSFDFKAEVDPKGAAAGGCPQTAPLAMETSFSKGDLSVTSLWLPFDGCHTILYLLCNRTMLGCGRREGKIIFNSSLMSLPGLILSFLDAQTKLGLKCFLQI